MSFISRNNNGSAYAPGWFLAHEECRRETREITQNHGQVVTGSNGAKHVPMGAFYPANDSSTVEGIVYEDVDVTTGNMPGSVVTSGVVYLDRLPAAPESGVQSALEGKGFVFISDSSDPIRPAYPTALTTLTVSFAESGTSGKTDPTVSGYTPKTGDSYVYKLGTSTTAATVSVLPGEVLTTGWTAWDGSSDITVAAGDDGKYMTIAVINAAKEAVAVGSGAVDRKS